MTHWARIYQAAILLLGAGFAVRQAVHWTSGNTAIFIVYLTLTTLTSLFKFGVPTAGGTISIGFIFILASIAQLSLGQTLIIGAAGVLAHQLRELKGRPDPLSILFHCAVIVLGIEAAHAVFTRMVILLPAEGLAAALPMAGTMLFLVTAFPLAATTALSEGELLRKVWQQRFLWSLPYYLAGSALAGLLAGVQQMPIWQTVLMVVPMLFLVYRAYGLQIDYVASEKKHAEELASLQMGMIEALALTIERKDITGTDQLHRMAVYAVGLGRAFGLDEEALKALRAAAVLHDIGQIAVPDHIIMKPGRLTPEEFDRLKLHPDVGAEIIERARFAYPVAPIVRAHHERWDGAGYPRGLAGDRIPIEARILAAVDTFVALTSNRHYRRALPMEKAIQILHEESGRSLDPHVVHLIAEMYPALEQEALSTQSGQSALPWRGELRPERAATAAARQTPEFLASIAAARKEEQEVLEFSRILGNSLNLHESLSALARNLRKAIPFSTMVLYMMRDRRLEAAFIEGDNYALFKGLELQLGRGATGRAVQERKPLINVDPNEDGFGGHHPEKAARLHSALCVPLDGADGVIGAITFYSEERDNFATQHLSLLLAIAPKVAVTVQNALRYSKAETQATYDFLTGLPNAGSLFVHLGNELARCGRNNSTLAVVLCDLDNFKQVNDRFGHLTGNKLLRAVGQTLKENCREYDFVARLGGDEFVLLLPGATEEAVRARLSRLAATVAETSLQVCGERLVALSMGCSYYPADGATSDELIREADERMYQDKAIRKIVHGSPGFPSAIDAALREQRDQSPRID
jgi:diguanylate cyclase (GGDEF)-like protein